MFSSFLFLMQRNYRFFYMFVFSTTLLCIYVFAFCWVYIVRIKDAEQTSIWRAMSKTPASIVLIIYTFISVWFVGGLSVFHFYLMATNQVLFVFSETSLSEFMYCLFGLPFRTASLLPKVVAKHLGNLNFGAFCFDGKLK